MRGSPGASSALKAGTLGVCTDLREQMPWQMIVHPGGWKWMSRAFPAVFPMTPGPTPPPGMQTLTLDVHSAGALEVLTGYVQFFCTAFWYETPSHLNSLHRTAPPTCGRAPENLHVKYTHGYAAYVGTRLE